MPKNMESSEATTSLPPRRNISEIKNKLRRAEAYRQMKRERKKVICNRCCYYRSWGPYKHCKSDWSAVNMEYTPAENLENGKARIVTHRKTTDSW